MKKKFLGVVLSVAMVAALLAGCGDKPAENDTPSDETPTEAPEAPADDDNKGGEDDQADAPASSGELIKVGVINNDPNESGYRTANDADMREKFTKEAGYDAQFVNLKDNAEQISAAANLIQSGIDYLLISAANTAGWESVLQDAQAQDVKVILFDRIVDADESLYEAGVVSDMAKEGETAVNWLAGQGLDEYNIIHIQGEMGSAAQVGRSGALQDKVDSDDKWNLVVQQTGNWSATDAQEIVQTVIDSKQDFNVIYAENDDMARGAVAALDKAGITHGTADDAKVIVMGYDCNKWALKELLAGNWNYDGQCNPFQADYIIDIINKLEAGQEISPKKIIMDEKGFDAKELTEDDIKTYGIGSETVEEKKE